MTNLRLSLPEGDDPREPLPLWLVRALCIRSGFPKLKGKGFTQHEDGIDLSVLEFAIDHAYFFGLALGSLRPDLARRVLAADPAGWAALDASTGRITMSDREVDERFAAPENFATEQLRMQPELAWLPWWWMGRQGSTPPHTGRARMHVLLRRFFAVNVLYGVGHPTEFRSHAEDYRQRFDERRPVGAFAFLPRDAGGLTAWIEETVEAFERINGPLPAAQAQGHGVPIAEGQYDR